VYTPSVILMRVPSSAGTKHPVWAMMAIRETILM
jgi:hypothetical protein